MTPGRALHNPYEKSPFYAPNRSDCPRSARYGRENGFILARCPRAAMLHFLACFSLFCPAQTFFAASPLDISGPLEYSEASFALVVCGAEKVHISAPPPKKNISVSPDQNPALYEMALSPGPFPFLASCLPPLGLFRPPLSASLGLAFLPSPLRGRGLAFAGSPSPPALV